MFTNHQLVQYMEKVYSAGWVYWYGTCGYKCTESLYERKKKQYPAHYTASRASGYKADIKAGRMCADCVGVIKSFFWKNGVIGGTNRYASNNCPDKSANGMFELCKEKGKISTIPDVPGLVVWRSGHIGVYVGNGYTIELRGFAYDCQRRKVSAGTWTHWGKLPASMIQYVETDDEPVDEIELGDRILKRGMNGSDVKELQTALITLGYNLPKYGADGDFGSETEAAVKEFQKAHGLLVDGHFGPKSYKALLDALHEYTAPDEDTPDGGSKPVRTVTIHIGDCWVRTKPGTDGDKIGVAHGGDKLIYADETSSNGWLKVEYKGAVGWVSGKFGRLD